MKQLIELIDIINRNKVKHIEVIGNLPPRKTKVQELYEKISLGELNNDKDAAAYFYESTPENRNYKELKKRLIQRLYNTTLFIDVQQAQFDEMGKAYYSCWKNYAIAKVLLGRGAYINAADLLEKTLKQSIKYEFNELILNICRHLRSQYGTIHFNKKKFYYYDDLYHQYSQRKEADILAEAFYAQIIVEFYGSKNKDAQRLSEQSQKYVKKLLPLVEKYDSYKLNLHYYAIRLTAATGVNDYNSAIDVCLEALAFFHSKSKYSHVALGVFYQQLLLVYWQQKKYEDGEALLKNVKKYVIEGNTSWFAYYNYFFLLCFHTQKYERALEIYKEAQNHARFLTQPEYHQERWKIYEAYLAYLKELSIIPSYENEKFRLGKFLNEVPRFSADKRARNIPILIIQILFLLLHKKYDTAIDRMEAINEYCNRHLKKDGTFRSNCFIKMLLKIIEADFHRAGAERKATKLLKRLQSVPLEVANQIYETEILPYEDLWEMALSSLENKFWKIK